MIHRICFPQVFCLTLATLLLLGCDAVEPVSMSVTTPSEVAATQTSVPVLAQPTITFAPGSPAPSPGQQLQTVTPVPSLTNTPLPTRARTSRLAPTDTPTPTSTYTPTLMPTDTPVPPTNTSTPTFTPAPPTYTPTPTPPPYDFVVVHQRIWTNEENGGVSANGTVTGCGYGHQIYVWVLDAAGNPLDGVVIGDTYNNPRHISGEKGPGHAQYDLHMNGFELLVVEDTNAGRPVTSEVSHVLSSNDWQIPVPWLIEGHYCATEEECIARRADPDGVGSNSLCWGHYSYEIVFQRTW
jgi:hypothetical protein